VLLTNPNAATGFSRDGVIPKPRVFTSGARDLSLY
jgi:hypothetical protein